MKLKDASLDVSVVSSLPKSDAWTDRVRTRVVLRLGDLHPLHEDVGAGLPSRAPGPSTRWVRSWTSRLDRLHPERGGSWYSQSYLKSYSSSRLGETVIGNSLTGATKLSSPCTGNWTTNLPLSSAPIHWPFGIFHFAGHHKTSPKKTWCEPRPTLNVHSASQSCSFTKSANFADLEREAPGGVAVSTTSQ